jgi:hypothetical protein
VGAAAAQAELRADGLFTVVLAAAAAAALGGTPFGEASLARLRHVSVHADVVLPQPLSGQQRAALEASYSRAALAQRLHVQGATATGSLAVSFWALAEGPARRVHSS